MSFEILYEGPLSEWPGPFWPPDKPIEEDERALRCLLSRRDALRRSGSLLLVGVFSATLVRPALAQSGAVQAAIVGHRVTREIVPVLAQQGAISDLRNETNRRQDGILTADFKTNGVVTDQQSQIVQVAAAGFIVGRFTGDTGSRPGQGLSTGYTSLGSLSAPYRVS